MDPRRTRAILPAPVIDDTVMIDRAEPLDSLATTLASLMRYRTLLHKLVLKDLKLKYRGSVLGFLWSLVNPLVMIAVYSFAFKYIIRVPTQGFVFLVMLGILAWTFFSNAAMMSTGAIADNGPLLKSVFFPRAILPIATVLFNFSQYLLMVVVFLPLMLIAFRIAPAAPMVAYPIFLVLQVVMTIGLALILSTGTAFFRDVRHLLEVALAVMFWTTPIVYELEQVPERFRPIVLASPMSSFVVAYKDVFFYRRWPEPLVWTFAIAYAIIAFAIGAALLLKFEDRFAERT
jgi:ABC-type polysaccharide/polyol phosphate export permease